MPGLLPHVDPDGLLEYSVVYTDRALNHMSQRFQRVMQDVSATLKQVYGARSAIVVPGSGSFGMEAVARQFATGKKVLVIRNGWFSYRWSQIFEMGAIPAETTVLKARTTGGRAAGAVRAARRSTRWWRRSARDKPDLVFAPHVETSAGMMLPDDYLRAVADAVHAHGGLFVLDCVASGAMWVDMAATGVDVLVSAPQKGWSSTPCAGLVMLGDAARERIDGTTSSSFSMDLKKWLSIMETHEKGQIAYHATCPPTAWRSCATRCRRRRPSASTPHAPRSRPSATRVRALLEARGIRSVAAQGFQSPCVIVSYTERSDLARTPRPSPSRACRWPPACRWPATSGPDFKTFRIGLFGLDKLKNVDRTVATFERALDAALKG